MEKGFFAFLVLIAFLPSALYALRLYAEEVNGIHATKQAMHEQQAIEVKGQDFEESFWRVVEYSAAKKERVLGEDLRRWKREMDMEIWYGNSHGQAYRQLIGEEPGEFQPEVAVDSNRVFVDGGEHDAVIAKILAGNSTGIYLIPQGCEHEYT